MVTVGSRFVIIDTNERANLKLLGELDRDGTKAEGDTGGEGLTRRRAGKDGEVLDGPLLDVKECAALLRRERDSYIAPAPCYVCSVPPPVVRAIDQLLAE